MLFLIGIVHFNKDYIYLLLIFYITVIRRTVEAGLIDHWKFVTWVRMKEVSEERYFSLNIQKTSSFRVLNIFQLCIGLVSLATALVHHLWPSLTRTERLPCP